MKIDLDGLYRAYAKCPGCGEDWSWGFEKKELVSFARSRLEQNEKMICRKCKKIFPFFTLVKQLVA
jgi:hypothetical protein